jgi:enoyl-CoA hydratase/carnithine racemase
VSPASEIETALARILAKLRASAPTAVAHTKRLLHESFHADPRDMIEEVLQAQRDCLTSWEIDEANRAWQEKREPLFDPKRKTEPVSSSLRPPTSTPGSRSDE